MPRGQFPKTINGLFFLVIFKLFLFLWVGDPQSSSCYPPITRTPTIHLIPTNTFTIFRYYTILVYNFHLFLFILTIPLMIFPFCSLIMLIFYFKFLNIIVIRGLTSCLLIKHLDHLRVCFYCPFVFFIGSHISLVFIYMPNSFHL